MFARRVVQSHDGQPATRRREGGALRTLVLVAFAVVVVSAGTAYGSPGQPLLLGQSNSAGSARTSLSSTTAGSQVFNATGKTSAGVVRGFNSGSGYGVDGETTNGDAGVFGSAINIGVKGVSSSSFGAGVYGQNTASGGGVTGTSAGGDGVHGAGAANGVHGLSSSGNGVAGNSASNTASGVYGENNVKGFGVAGRANNGVGMLGDSSNGWAMRANGNVQQSLGGNGWVKAMALINANGDISRCYNSQQTGAWVSSGGCGIGVTVFGACLCGYTLDFGFDMTNRYESATPQTFNEVLIGNILPAPASTAVEVGTWSASHSYHAESFFIIVY